MFTCLHISLFFRFIKHLLAFIFSCSLGLSTRLLAFIFPCSLGLSNVYLPSYFLVLQVYQMFTCLHISLFFRFIKCKKYQVCTERSNSTHKRIHFKHIYCGEKKIVVEISNSQPSHSLHDEHRSSGPRPVKLCSISNFFSFYLENIKINSRI